MGKVRTGVMATLGAAGFGGGAFVMYKVIEALIDLGWVGQFVLASAGVGALVIGLIYGGD